MRWKKLGRIFDPNQIARCEEMISHASTPSPLIIGDNEVRIFYSSRDTFNRSSVSFFDLEISTLKILYAHDKPILRFGEEDTFFSDGISLGNVFNWNGEKYIAFMGWKVPQGKHWFGQLGLLRVNNKNQLNFVLNSPVFPINKEDSISISYPWVCHKESTELTYWYGTTKTWEGPNSDMIHLLKKGSTNNLLNWESGNTVLTFDLKEFQAFSSPTVLEFGDSEILFYSYRGQGLNYKIGSAELTNQNPVATKKDFGISENLEDWESEMQCYPRVFKLLDRQYMLYNGNQYGKTGIGIALLEV